MTKTIFDINEAQMSETKSTYTLTEIYQQPATWKKTCQQITELKDELKAFEHSQIEKNKSSLSDKNAIITSWRNILSVLKETGYDYLYQDDITKVADVLREYYGL